MAGEWDVVGSRPLGEEVLPWSVVATRAIGNIPKSAAHFATGMWDAVTHPIDTARGVFDLGAGALRNAMPDAVRSTIDQYDSSPEAGERASAAVSTVGQSIKQSYGSMEGFKRKLADDPVGVAGDASTLFTGGAAFAPKAGLIGRSLNAAATYTNPITAATGAVSLASKAVPHMSGLLTGLGSESVSQSFKAGESGKSAYWDNLKGDVSQKVVLKQAEDALSNMRAERQAKYKTDIASTNADKKPLDFAPITQGMNRVLDSLEVEGISGISGKSSIGKAERATITELENIVDEWRRDPNVHNASGLDGLKRRIDALYPESPAHKNAQRAVSNMRGVVKDEIVKQHPEYAKTMKAYEEALSLENDIRQALSLGGKSSDTAIRKLLSVTRNNANANYGYRAELLDALETHGGRDLMPALAGQQASSWTPRGIVGNAGAVGTMGYALAHLNPYALGALLPQSPKLTGAIGYGLGKGSRFVKDVGRHSPVSAEDAKRLALLMSQSGLLSGQQ